MQCYISVSASSKFEVAIREPRGTTDKKWNTANPYMVKVGVAVGTIGGTIVGVLCPPVGAALAVFSCILGLWHSVADIHDQKIAEEERIAKENARHEEIMSKLHAIGIDLAHVKTDVAYNQMLLNRTVAEMRQLSAQVERNFDALVLHFSDDTLKEHSVRKINSLFDYIPYVAEDLATMVQFNTIFNSHPPMWCIQDFISRLFVEHNTPITVEIQKNILNSKKIMAYYANMFATMAYKATLVMEFHYVFNNDSKLYKGLDKFVNRLVVKVNEFQQYVAKSCIKTDAFWPDVVRAQVVLSNKGNSNVTDIAGKVADILDGILTEDVFTVTVFKCESKEQMPRPLHITNAIDKAVPRNLEFYKFYTTSSMLFHYENSSEICTVVQRNEKYHENKNVASAFLRTYAFKLKYLEMDEEDLEYHDEDHEKMINMFLASIKPTLSGFKSKSIIPEIRFTNDETAMLNITESNISSLYYGFHLQ